MTLAHDITPNHEPDVRSRPWPPTRDIVVTDFGSIGFARPPRLLLAQVSDGATRTRTVDPLQYTWRSDGDRFRRHADTQARALLNDGLKPNSTFLGQCAGVLFTTQVAAYAEHADAKPASVILVDPVVPSPADVAEHVRDLVLRIGGDAHVAGETAAGLPVTTDLGTLTAYLDRALRPVVSALISEPGLDESDLAFMLDELVGRYVDWVGFLAAHVRQPVIELAAQVHIVGAVEDSTMDAVRSRLGSTQVTAWPVGEHSGTELVAEQIAGILRSR